MILRAKQPKVTVLIPAFNAEHYIAEAVDSMLAQTLTDFELLLIDDASTDATPEIIERYAALPRVRIVRHTNNQGQPQTRNEGLDLARGEYIAFLDADDCSAPERLAQQAEYLDSHPEITVLGTWRHKIDSNGCLLAQDRRREPTTSDEIIATMLFRCPIHHPTIMARRRVLAKYRYDLDFIAAQDYDLWTRLPPIYQFAALPQRLTFYRQHNAQISEISESQGQPYSQKIYTRLLRALNIEFDSQDLQYHALLRGGRRLFKARMGRDMDLAYVQWAREWLERLLAANRVRQRYPEPAFSRVVGGIWWSVCRKATRETGMAVWGEFIRSSLKGSVLNAWLYNLCSLELGISRRKSVP